MKAIPGIFILLIFHFSVQAQDQATWSENPVEQIKITGNIHVTLQPSDSMVLKFESDKVPANLGIEWSESKLSLKTRSEIKQSPAIRVHLFYKSLNGIELNRGARLQSADTLKAKNLSLRVESGGKVEFTILCDSLSARVNQGADIILHGSTRSQVINAYTVGNFLGYDLKAVNTWVKAATGAQVKVNSSGLLNANATSKAFVGYLGVPETKEFKSSVGGEITQHQP